LVGGSLSAGAARLRPQRKSCRRAKRGRMADRSAGVQDRAGTARKNDRRHCGKRSSATARERAGFGRSLKSTLQWSAPTVADWSAQRARGRCSTEVAEPQGPPGGTHWPLQPELDWHATLGECGHAKAGPEESRHAACQPTGIRCGTPTSRAKPPRTIRQSPHPCAGATIHQTRRHQRTPLPGERFRQPVQHELQYSDDCGQHAGLSTKRNL
jgi:hypothetical protein